MRQAYGIEHNMFGEDQNNYKKYSFICTYLFPFVDKLEKAKFIESQAGKPVLLDRNGQGFISENKYRNRTYWCCRESRKQYKRNQKKCPARAITDGIYIKSWRFEHNHPFEDFEYENEFKDSTELVEGSEDTTLGQIETKDATFYHQIGTKGIIL